MCSRNVADAGSSNCASSTPTTIGLVVWGIKQTSVITESKEA
jgi:hypothetical protein